MAQAMQRTELMERQVIHFLVRYLYTGQYDNQLSDPPSSTPDAPLKHPKLAMVFSDIHNENLDRKYTYEFPHTCERDHTGNCATILLCPHHLCDYHCRNDCQGFICNLCYIPEPVALNCLIHSKMHTIADKYDVVGLKELSRKLFTLSCKAIWNDDAFLSAISHAFSTTFCEDLGLRDPIMEVISKHMELMHKPEMQALMLEHGDLAIGVLLKNTE
ncbi:predicted protein [Pyrenophora tritici-repentis Pt-1C-BFP]|uniref:Uncharacterized protein n=2 Tax=Pyrenophora tritici-repentis TaxID=45151 RepID=B2VTE7_PYRTR|nr:uncharacterized protein PTRG_01911 [Pyrenophora tritici-repentis Pt-1C-BFP]EDU41349.1 predicted protein [Pyrenophora tritici-repentis Pt-1C-BFP]